MATLGFQQYTERMVGEGHPTLAGTNERALRALLSQSGYNPDADPFPGLMGPVYNVKAFGSPQAAIIEAEKSPSGGTVFFPSPGPYLSGPLVVAGQNIVLRGPGGGTWGLGTPLLKYNGAAGGTMLRFESTAAGSGVEHMSFDADSLARTCVHFVSGSGQSLGSCFINRVAFKGYLRGLVLGIDDTVTLGVGQLSPFSASHLRWDGGVANAIGLLVNAQNMEWGTFTNLYFDPFTALGGGPYQNHDYHVYQFAGNMVINGMLTTRADIAALGIGDQLIMNGLRCEEDKIITTVRLVDWGGPVVINGLQGRGLGGVLTAINYQAIGLGCPLVINGAILPGNILIGPTDARSFYLTGIRFTGGAGLALSGPRNQTGVIEQTNGQRDEWSAGAKVGGRAVGGAVFQAFKGLTYGTTVATDASLGNMFQLTVTDGVAFTMSAPTNPTLGQFASWRIRNSSGGAMGAVTWEASGGFTLAGAWVNPANGWNRTITFQFDGARWYEVSRTAADVAN